jgi:uncharacterized membrane protein
MSIRDSLIGTALLALAASAPSLGQCQYSIQFVNAPNCGTNPSGETPFDLSDSGAFAGRYGDCTFTSKAMMWSAATGVVTLPMPPGAYDSIAYAISESGTVVGQILMLTGPIEVLPAVWIDGALTTVELPPTATQGWAMGIDEAGNVAGYWFDQSIGPYPFVRIDGAFHDLTDEIPKGWAYAHVMAMAKNGILGGRMFAESGPDSRGFVRIGQRWSVVEPTPGNDRTEIRDVSESGVAGGRMAVPFLRNPGAFLWRPILWENGVTTELPLPPNRNEGQVWKVNNHGQAVGQVGTVSPETMLGSKTVAVWIDGEAFELKPLIAPIPGLNGPLDGYAINDKNEIVTTVSVGTSGPQAAILRPIRTRAADLVTDCKVNVRDLSALIGVWGATYTEPDGFGDLDGDGTVDGYDLGILLADWGPTP